MSNNDKIINTGNEIEKQRTLALEFSEIKAK